DDESPLDIGQRSPATDQVTQNPPWRHESVYRPRHQTTNQDREVVPDRAGIVVPRRGEPFEIVRHEETLEVCGAMDRPHSEVPRQAGDLEETECHDDVRLPNHHACSL